MSHPDIQAISEDVDAIRDMLTSELENIESTVFVQGEEIGMVDARSKENQNVIRAIVRRFENQLRKVDERISKLEGRQ